MASLRDALGVVAEPVGSPTVIHILSLRDISKYDHIEKITFHFSLCTIHLNTCSLR